jgi:hypothetical protein
VIAKVCQQQLPSGTVLHVLATGPGSPGDVGAALQAAVGSGAAAS